MTKIPLSREAASAATRRSVLADGSQCLRTSKFTQVLTPLAGGAMLVTGIGYNSGVCAPLITEELLRAVPASGKLHTFVNLTEETGITSAAREWWGDWVKQNRAQLATTHVLMRSRVMEMAISVMTMVTGSEMIRAHISRKTFEDTLAKHVPGFRSLPNFPDLPPMLP